MFFILDTKEIKSLDKGKNPNQIYVKFMWIKSNEHEVLIGMVVSFWKLWRKICSMHSALSKNKTNL